jgi:hypothetical protein
MNLRTVCRAIAPQDTDRRYNLCTKEVVQHSIFKGSTNVQGVINPCTGLYNLKTRKYRLV